MTQMTDEKPEIRRGWLDRLSHALLREPQDREQLLSLLRDAEQRDLLDADALAMIEGVLQISQLRVRDIMVPRAQMIAITESDTFEEFLPLIITSTHSRFPVLSDNQEEAIGILHAKDLLYYHGKAQENFTIKDVLRPAVVIPESKRLDVLLGEFKVNRNHMAIIVDEYGSIAGLVTIEDVIEQIVGDIEDEFDIAETDYIKVHSEHEHIIKALTPLDEFNAYFSTHFNENEYDTVGGMVLSAFGRMPARGDTVVIDDFQFKVLRADKRRIHLLQINTIKSGYVQK